MKEFGSDFHYLPISDKSNKTIFDYYPDASFYATGRQALRDLYEKSGWSCLWVPEYFCYDVLASLENAGLKLKFYHDSPLSSENEQLRSLSFHNGDALLRMNYFGLRSRRQNDGIPVPVVEDHTHDLIGDWATSSNADWCIASLRKTLPLAEGGILWSPKGLKLNNDSKLTSENVQLSQRRWAAMKKKSQYLNGTIHEKSVFRSEMILTENLINSISISSIDEESFNYITRFDIDNWYNRKKENRKIVKTIHLDHIMVLEPEDDKCNPFSLTMMFDDEVLRDKFREYLINQSIYPAILWEIPKPQSPDVMCFSKRMLSIHCDARYSCEDMSYLLNILSDFKS